MNDTAIIHDGARQDATRHDSTAATPPDSSRPDATRAYRLTLDEVAHRFDQAGLARSMRTLQRYCATGRLDCLKTDTATGIQYFVDEHSVERTITELRQLSALTQHDTSRHDATGDGAGDGVDAVVSMRHATDAERHDATRHDMAQPTPHELAATTQSDTARQGATHADIHPDNMRHAEPSGTPPAPAPVAAPDTSRQDAPGEPDIKDRIIQMQGQEISFLREQISVKDEQLKDASERSRETNILIQGLQNMVLTLQAPLGEFTRRLGGGTVPPSESGFPPRQS